MKKQLILISIFLLALFTSCNYVNFYTMMKKGSVEQDEFKVQIPFEYRLGLIVLKVKIAGVDYDFVMDTGAPNVVSKELAAKLGVTSNANINVGDSQGNKDYLDFVSIDTIGIGDINFLNTGAAVADINQSKDLACLNVDGFIGSNLMRKAIWRFDYKNQQITIASAIDSVAIPDSAEVIDFSTKLTGTPIVDIRLNDVVVSNAIVDLGSNGGFNFPKRDYFRLKNSDPCIKSILSYGSSSSGLFGKGKVDSSYLALLPSISMGQTVLKNTIVSFAKESSALIGTDFFNKYDVVISWFSNKLYLIKDQGYEYSSYYSYGFVYSYQDDKLVVSKIVENSDAAAKGLLLGDVIVRIGDYTFEELPHDIWCDIIENKLLLGGKSVTLVVMRDNKELSFSLASTKLL